MSYLSYIDIYCFVDEHFIVQNVGIKIFQRTTLKIEHENNTDFNINLYRYLYIKQEHYIGKINTLPMTTVIHAMI